MKASLLQNCLRHITQAMASKEPSRDNTPQAHTIACSTLD